MGHRIENSCPSDRLKTSTGQSRAKTQSPKVEFSVILPSGVSLWLLWNLFYGGMHDSARPAA